MFRCIETFDYDVQRYIRCTPPCLISLANDSLTVCARGSNLSVHLATLPRSFIFPHYHVEPPNRFVAASRRRDEKLKESGVRARSKETSKEDTAKTERSAQEDEKAGGGSEGVVAGGREHARKTSQKPRARTTSSGRARRKTKGGGGSPDGKEKKEAGEEGEKRFSKPEDIFQELRECSIYHDV